MNKPLTIGAVCHFHSERHALPGFIEAAKAMFDEVVLVSSPMDGTPHCEESLAIARASGCKVILDTLSQGFGALRTRCISYSSCDWVFVLDADERVWRHREAMGCRGTDKFPEVLNPCLEVITIPGLIPTIDARQVLNDLIKLAEEEGSLAICGCRRHWMDAPGEFKRPAQNWNSDPPDGDHDWQLRLVKNTPWLCYDPTVKMHERLLDTRTWNDPKFLRSGDCLIDHYSHHYRAMEPEQNTEDIATYEALSPGCTKDMWISHQPQA